MISHSVVWHAHHDSKYPLEILDESFAERMATINLEKSAFESPEQIARRKSLFKRVKGGVKVLPKDLQRLYSAIGRQEVDAGETKSDRVMQENIDAIMALHAKQCGCAWTKKKRNIFNFDPKVKRYR
jgi:hypothetical protein